MVLNSIVINYILLLMIPTVNVKLIHTDIGQIMEFLC